MCRILNFSNSVLVQWTAPPPSEHTQANFPISFTQIVFLYMIKGNFDSYQSGGATYNDLSQFLGYIGRTTLSGYEYRCSGTSPKCLFIGI
jgi:hypothetical protein